MSDFAMGYGHAFQKTGTFILNRKIEILRRKFRLTASYNKMSGYNKMPPNLCHRRSSVGREVGYLHESHGFESQDRHFLCLIQNSTFLMSRAQCLDKG